MTITKVRFKSILNSLIYYFDTSCIHYNLMSVILFL